MSLRNKTGLLPRSDLLPALILCFVLLPVSARSVSACQPIPQPAFDLYYLSVGSSYYATDDSPHGFKNLEGANKSAKRVAEYLDRAGAVGGITLVSDRDKLVTRDDILTALNDLLTKVRHSKSKNPLIIFYFCGHGVSEGIGWNHFSIPGAFKVPTERVNIQTLIDFAVSAGEISDAIEKEKFAGLILLDACYEGKEAELPETVISRQLAANLTGIFKVLRNMNEFHGPMLAVFSTKPGSIAPMVADPLDLDSSLSVGPLARRVMMSFDQAFRNRSGLMVGEFLKQMARPDFDRETESVITLSVPERPTLELIKYPLARQNVSEPRLGSGHRGKKVSQLMFEVRFDRA